LKRPSARIARRETLDMEGVRLSCVQLGTGRDVVYLHGALTTSDEGIIALGATLAPHCRLTAFDRPGHGLSDPVPNGGSIWTQARLIAEAWTELGLVRPIVIGHSFGAAVALAIALRTPDHVEGIIALAPIAFPELRPELTLFGPRALPLTGSGWTALARPADPALLFALWNGMFLPQGMTSAFRTGFPFQAAGAADRLQAEGADALQLAAGLARAVSLYRRCQRPVHILQGDRDLVVNPFLHGRPLVEWVPDARFSWLAGLGHMAHHFRPEAVLKAMQQMGGFAPRLQEPYPSPADRRTRL
jgi:pimeloyl-ACP methyl ester carboxylesterase